jgi:membrane peptidoglycan carboxypeptidase
MPINIRGASVSVRLLVCAVVIPLLTFESFAHSFISIPSVTPQYEKGKRGVINKITVMADGLEEPICEQGINHRELSNLSDFSPHLRQAIVASEDSYFDWHLGLDPFGFVRAVSTFGKQGGSTITQQVARTVYSKEVGGDKNIGRKVRELLYANTLELFYPKDEILKTYLNRNHSLPPAKDPEEKQVKS